MQHGHYYLAGLVFLGAAISATFLYMSISGETPTNDGGSSPIKPPKHMEITAQPPPAVDSIAQGLPEKTTNHPHRPAVITNIKLTGIFRDSINPARSFVIIETGSSRSIRAKTGDTIAAGTTLEAIHSNHIFILVEGQRYRVDLSSASQGGEPPPMPSSYPASTQNMSPINSIAPPYRGDTTSLKSPRQIPSSRHPAFGTTTMIDNQRTRAENENNSGLLRGIGYFGGGASIQTTTTSSQNNQGTTPTTAHNSTETKEEPPPLQQEERGNHLPAFMEIREIDTETPAFMQTGEYEIPDEQIPSYMKTLEP